MPSRLVQEMLGVYESESPKGFFQAIRKPTGDALLRRELKQLGFKPVKLRREGNTEEVWQAKRGRVTHTVSQQDAGWGWRYKRNTVPDYNFGTGPENMARTLPRYLR